jgi:hypothetical protein
MSKSKQAQESYYIKKEEAVVTGSEISLVQMTMLSYILA